jgi:hypothetical protein
MSTFVTHQAVPLSDVISVIQRQTDRVNKATPVFIFEYVWNLENVGTLAAVGTLNGKKGQNTIGMTSTAKTPATI